MGQVNSPSFSVTTIYIKKHCYWFGFGEFLLRTYISKSCLNIWPLEKYFLLIWIKNRKLILILCANPIWQICFQKTVIELNCFNALQIPNHLICWLDKTFVPLGTSNILSGRLRVQGKRRVMSEITDCNKVKYLFDDLRQTCFFFYPLGEA